MKNAQIDDFDPLCVLHLRSDFALQTQNDEVIRSFSTSWSYYGYLGAKPHVRLPLKGVDTIANTNQHKVLIEFPNRVVISSSDLPPEELKQWSAKINFSNIWFESLLGESSPSEMEAYIAKECGIAEGTVIITDDGFEVTNHGVSPPTRIYVMLLDIPPFCKDW